MFGIITRKKISNSKGLSLYSFLIHYELKLQANRQLS